MAHPTDFTVQRVNSKRMKPYRIPKELVERLAAEKAALKSNDLAQVGTSLLRLLAVGWSLIVGMDLYRFFMVEFIKPLWYFILSLGFLTIIFVTSALATPEARCTELGVNCLCSEPFQMTGFNKVGSGPDSYWDPNDTTTKQCQASASFPNTVIVRHDNSPPQVGSNATILSAFPSGHTVSRYLQGLSGHTGSWEIAHIIGGSVSKQRISFRWYMLFSTDYAYTNDGGCLNSAKWFEPQPGGVGGLIFDTSFGVNSRWLIYGWGQNPPSQPAFIPAPDCCLFGPGWDANAETAITKGHLYRIEVVMRNFDGTNNTIIQAYRKNVTIDGPEYKVIDTSLACNGCRSSGGPENDWPGGTFQAPAALGRAFLNGFRNGTCAGFRVWSHMMVAAWNTDAGQRILGAVEIEGDGGEPPPPTLPATLVHPGLRRVYSIFGSIAIIFIVVLLIYTKKKIHADASEMRY